MDFPKHPEHSSPKHFYLLHQNLTGTRNQVRENLVW